MLLCIRVIAATDTYRCSFLWIKRPERDIGHTVILYAFLTSTGTPLPFPLRYELQRAPPSLSSCNFPAINNCHRWHARVS